MKLTVKEGKVGFIMRAGKDFSRNEMGVNAANAIIEKGEVTESTLFKDYPLCVDDTFFFAAAFLTRKDYDEMFELSEEYCDIANERIQKAMQDKATSEKGL